MALQKIGEIPIYIEGFSGVAMTNAATDGASDGAEALTGFTTIHRLDNEDAGYKAPSMVDLPSTTDGTWISAPPALFEGAVWAGPKGAVSGFNPAGTVLDGLNHYEGRSDGMESAISHADEWLTSIISAFNPSLPGMGGGDLTLDIPGELIADLPTSKSTVSVSGEAIWQANFSAIAAMFVEFNKAELEYPDEWMKEFNYGSYDSAYAWGTVYVNPGALDATVEGTVSVYFDDTTGEFLSSVADSSDEAVLAAEEARKQTNAEVVNSLNVYSQTGADEDLIDPTRPEATQSSDLGGLIVEYDRWWSSVRSTLAEAEQATPSTAELYAAYQNEGGTSTQEEWLTAIRGTTDVADSDSVDDRGWVDALVDGAGSALGGLKDVLLSWGPLETAQGYATVKATDAVTGSKVNLPLLLIGGLTLFMLFR